MRYLSTRAHGIVDYTIGLLLILLAWFPTAESTEGSVAISLIFGTTLILNSMLSDYELGIVGLLTMPFHLWIDLMAGLHLAAAPWFFNFSHAVYLPHLILGVVVIAAGLTTRTTPSGAQQMKTSSRRPISQPEGAP